MRPESPLEYQLKLDGYRAIAFEVGGKLYLRSRNNKDFATRYPGIVAGLAKLPRDRDRRGGRRV